MTNERKNIRELTLKHAKLQTLINYVNIDTLTRAHNTQPSGKAVGVDGVTKEEYGRNCGENIANLVKRMKSMSYRPNPVRRTYIPKGNGSFRPLGIPSYEDKLVQKVMADVLSDVYEPLFLNCSYGFREGRSAHDAIREINQICMFGRVNYVVDCDIKGFFDNIDQEQLVEFLELHIGDKNFIRYIRRFLKAGIMEEGKLLESDKGTPQGGLISPVLANVYLHYVLDTWFEFTVKPLLKGKGYLVRYADDFVILLEKIEDTQRVFKGVVNRFAKYGLQIAEEKTKIIPFGRFKGTKETFDFLGFTHYNKVTRTGKYTVGHRISKKKLKQKKDNMKKWIKESRSTPIGLLLPKMNKKLVGTFRYYGINGMFDELMKLYKAAKYGVYKWFNRRSQRRSFKYSDFLRTWKFYIVKPRIYVDIWGWNPKPNS